MTFYIDFFDILTYPGIRHCIPWTILCYSNGQFYRLPDLKFVLD